MKKEELKETILAILFYLKNNIENDAPLTLDDAIAYLQSDDSPLEHIDYRHNSLDKTFEALKEEYKKLAVESIDSYENSTKQMQNIAKKQHEQIEAISSVKCEDTIDLDLIKEKFSNIQNHMLQEVQKANEQITQLKEKVKLLEESSNLDALTKTFNRRALEDYLEKLTRRGSLKRELHLLMLDIDNFKQINDQYGHIAGDKILIFIAQTLKKMLREGDKVFRYGGEEFVIVLNRIDAKNCLKIANRILKIISSNKLIYKNHTMQVTVSIGGTKYENGDTPESLLDRADKALYAAKQGGKNKFISEGE